ncbi:hypothetical protein HMPREF3226_00739 [Prevotella corporis]|uniref:Uncharacterized protein n=1 Tax=Prevotella corporis TaxID=28128 RepID=A0A133QHA1_9BACT|nr:hypothetical protein HMPREF3226_00739 [Prevotella corporis]
MAKHERSNTNHDFGHDEDSQYIKNKKHKFFLPLSRYKTYHRVL